MTLTTISNLQPVVAATWNANFAEGMTSEVWNKLSWKTSTGDYANAGSGSYDTTADTVFSIPLISRTGDTIENLNSKVVLYTDPGASVTIESQYSVDNSSWTTIDTRTLSAAAIVILEGSILDINSNDVYFRVRITSSADSDFQVRICDIQLDVSTADKRNFFSFYPINSYGATNYSFTNTDTPAPLATIDVAAPHGTTIHTIMAYFQNYTITGFNSTTANFKVQYSTDGASFNAMGEDGPNNADTGDSGQYLKLATYGFKEGLDNEQLWIQLQMVHDRGATFVYNAQLEGFIVFCYE